MATGTTSALMQAYPGRVDTNRIGIPIQNAAGYIARNKSQHHPICAALEGEMHTACSQSAPRNGTDCSSMFTAVLSPVSVNRPPAFPYLNAPNDGTSRAPWAASCFLAVAAARLA
eukprot:TRINITY_DN1906_c0_g1_i2.p1 TRINITY_DN1906_c0_g1~~TRINITY_DN1906_c0_g1_i2.p1  ORF type:complete len:115 (-),score=13.16 TRINITY_DN1906_c0_g1_i2:247-591(-)